MQPLLLAVVTLTVPLGPEVEQQARELAEPYRVEQPIVEPWVLSHLRVEPTRIRYAVARRDGPAAAEVLVQVTPSGDLELSVAPSPSGPDPIEPGARRAAETLADHIRARLSSVEARGPPGGPLSSPTTARILLALLVAGLLLTRRRLACALPVVPRAAWIGVGLVSGGALLAALLLPDVVAYQAGLGYDHARAVSGVYGGPFPDRLPDVGHLHLELTRWLGAAAPLGREPFYASRVALALCPLLLFLLTAALTDRPWVAFAAALLFAVQPAWWFIGTSDSATAPGVMLMLLAAWLVASAGRSRDRPTLLLAGLCLALLAYYRFVGPLVAAPVGLLVFAWRSPHGDRRWWLWVAGAAVAVISVSAPQALELWTASSDYVATWHADPFERHLLGSSVWVAPAFYALTVGGLVAAVVLRPRVGLPVALLVFAVMVATSQSLSTWANQPRYQAWVLPPAALAGAILLGALQRHVGRGVMLLLFPLVVWLALGTLRRAELLALEHPEQAQLQLWRESMEELPRDALLVVPSDAVGRTTPSLPDAELRGRRPDVRLMGLEEFLAERDHFRERPAFWFEPLYCHVQPHSRPVPSDADCAVARRRLRLEPRRVRNVPTRVPATLWLQGVSDNLWVPVPYPKSSVEIGLFRVAGG